MEFDSLSSTPVTTAPVYSPPPPPQVQQSPEPAATSTNAPSKRDVQAADKADVYDGKQVKIDPNDKELLDQIDRTFAKANKKLEPLFVRFDHRVHEKTNQLMVSVINTATDEVIREIPPEKNLDALAKMWELVGILVDEKR